MLLCIAGKNDIAVEGLLESIRLRKKYGFEIGVVCNKTETGKNNWQRSLRWSAQKYNIREYSLEDLYSMEDLVFISLEYDRIIIPERFKSKKLFNIHFSFLPMYKGMYTSVIPLLFNEKYSGVTLHFIDSGIDTGRIIAQKKIEIASTDTGRDLYFKYIDNSIVLFKENIEKLVNGQCIESYEQPIQNASYFSKNYLDFSNIKIDLNQVSINIYNQLRAFNFREYQLPVVFGRKVISCKLTNVRSRAKVGTVLNENEAGCIIATVDYNLILYWDRFDELMEACRIGDLGTVYKICSVKEHINQVGKNGWTPLIVATYFGHYNIVQELLTIGGNIYAVNYNGTNLLMYAKDAYIKYADDRLFKLFYKLGLSLEAEDYEGHDLKYYCKSEGIEMIGDIMLK